MPKRSAHQVFVSRVDRWVIALLVAPILLAAGVGVSFLLAGRPDDASEMFLAAALVTVVTGVLVVPCRYTLLDDSLSVRCGLICYGIPYTSIRSVEASNTLRSGPALSMRRVAIKTDRREHILSPLERERFIETLRGRLHAVATDVS